MSKVLIMTDSNSGITQDEGLAMGVKVLPMPFLIGDETFFEDIDFTQEEFYEKLGGEGEVSTSQPSPEAVTSAWDELLARGDEIVYIPMSSGLSGSCQTARMLAEDYDGRVQEIGRAHV